MGGSGCLRQLHESPCEDRIVITPEPRNGVLSLVSDRPHEITAYASLCQGDPSSYTFAWFYDANGNGQFDEPEKTPASLASQWIFLACKNEKGRHLARVEARPVGVEANTLPTLSQDFTIEVTLAPDLRRPLCYSDSKSRVLSLNLVDRHSGVSEITSALSCVEPYVQNNLCDFEAAYFTALLKVSNFAFRIPERFENRNSLKVSDVISIVDEELTPIITILLTLDQKAPSDFQFQVEGKYQLTAFEDLPYLEGDETIHIVLQGIHDMALIRALASLAQFFRAALDLGLSYKGLLRFILDTPRLDQVDLSYRHVFLRKVESDSEFLRLDETSTPSAHERLSRSRGSFMDGISRLIKAVDTVRNQEDKDRSQRLRILRYWDCGKDGVCPCNDPELNLLACPNRPEEYQGPDADGTEKNGRFDPGEPVGTDRFLTPDAWVLSFPSDLDEFKKNLELVRVNLEGPDPLDLEQIFPGIRIGLNALGIPYPEIRLSEWFLTPSHPRDLLPLYTRSSLDFIIDTEGEPFHDLGYDGKSSREEVVITTPNPRNHPLGTPYDPITNPDPHFDDLDGLCNRVCNFTDRFDNDGDALNDSRDEAVFRGFDIPIDLGVESNFTFDFVDLNGNWAHDCSEPSEPFEDIGVVDKNGNLVGSGNKKWDFADRAHRYPRGSDVGPRGDLDLKDPPNGSNGDPANQVPGDREVRVGLISQSNSALLNSPVVQYEGLFDPYYLFFPDPTFSGVLRFPEEVRSINGELLTANAKLHRFFNKILEVAALFSGPQRRGDGIPVGFREGNGHPCSNRNACIAAVERLGGTIPNACP